MKADSALLDRAFIANILLGPAVTEKGHPRGRGAAAHTCPHTMFHTHTHPTNTGIWLIAGSLMIQQYAWDPMDESPAPVHKAGMPNAHLCPPHTRSPVHAPQGARLPASN